MIENGQLPPKDAVRLEEFVNYFPYSYGQPEGDAPVAVDVEVGTAPWAPKHKLVRIGIEAPKALPEERKASNLVFLLDVSGSMSQAGKIEALSPAAKGFITEVIGRLGEENVAALKDGCKNLERHMRNLAKFGVPVIGDIELFAQARADLPEHKVVGITGTNGKSTTTALVHHILKTASVPTTMGGNIGLPILDGISVLEQWRRAGRAMPVLILTARDTWSEKVSGLDAGADDYLTKPFTFFARSKASSTRSAVRAIVSLLAEIKTSSMSMRSASSPKTSSFNASLYSCFSTFAISSATLSKR